MGGRWTPPPESLVKVHPQGLLGGVLGSEFHGGCIFDGPEAQEGPKYRVVDEARSEIKL